MSALPMLEQLLTIVKDLPPHRQSEVLDFALFLHDRERVPTWDTISDAEAAALKAEFAEEDLAFAEVGMTDYLARLEHEDKRWGSASFVS